MARNLVSVFLFVFVFVFVFVDGGDEQKLFTHGALILTPDIHERPTERDRGGALQTSVLCNQIKRKQSNRLCKRHDNSNWKLWNLENKPEIFARTKVEIVGQKAERKLLLTQETLLFWIADTKLPLLKYSKAIAHPKHSWISQMVLFW